MPSSLFAWVRVLAIMASALIVYSPALRAGFIWDDNSHITDNPFMEGGLADLWRHHAFYYPLTSTSFWIMRRIWGLNPLPFHLATILLHGINAALLGRLLERLRIPWAWFAAGLFALHPVNAQSVAWATELKNTQSGLFYLLSLLAYVEFLRGGRREWIGLAAALFVPALLSKTSVVALPAVLPILHLLTGRTWRKPADLLGYAPFAALAAGAALATVGFHEAQVTDMTQWGETPAERIILAGRCVWLYFSKMIWPVNLSFMYPRWHVDAGRAISYLPIAGVVVAGMALARQWRRGWRGTALAAAYYVACLLPVLNFLKMFYTIHSYAADHWQYLALMGGVAWMAAGAERVTRAVPVRRTFGAGLPAARAILCGSALLLCAAATWNQAHIYASPETLWTDTLRKNPDCWNGLTDMGVIQLDRGDVATAERMFLRSIEIKPKRFEPNYNLARIDLNRGNLEGAAARLVRADELAPDTYEVLVTLGVVRAAQGRLEEAIQALERATALRPDLEVAINALGKALARAGRDGDAVARFGRAIQIKPNFVEARMNLGEALTRLGRRGEAAAQYREILRMKPDQAAAREALGKLGEAP